MMSGREDSGTGHASSHSGPQGWGMNDRGLLDKASAPLSSGLALSRVNNPREAVSSMFFPASPWSGTYLHVMVLGVGPQRQTEPCPCSRRFQSPATPRFSKSQILSPSPLLWCCLGLSTSWTPAPPIFPTPKGTKGELAFGQEGVLISASRNAEEKVPMEP